MPLLYESPELTRGELHELIKNLVCADCGAATSVFYDMPTKRQFLACTDWTRTHHDNVGKPNRAEKNSYSGGVFQMVELAKQHGLEKQRALAKYQGVTSLSRVEAMEIMEVIWPKAPVADKTAAAILCASYGLNPLANHIFLIPFKDKHTQQLVWARVWGIKAKRLLASRKGAYSYLDMSPRLMTPDEQIKVWGAVDEKNLNYITHLRDMKTGAEVYGFGKWPKADGVYGADKGNTQANMASIRSESQALDRLRPAEMANAAGFHVSDEQYIPTEDEGFTGEFIEGEFSESPPIAQNAKSEGIEAQGGIIPPKEAENAPSPQILANGLNLDDVRQILDELQWTDVGKYLMEHYKVTGRKVSDMLKQLTTPQALEFVKVLYERQKLS